MDKLATAQLIADKINGRVWTKTDDKGNLTIVRVYGPKKGYAQINDDGVNIDELARSDYQPVKDMLSDQSIANYRA